MSGMNQRKAAKIKVRGAIKEFKYCMLKVAEADAILDKQSEMFNTAVVPLRELLLQVEEFFQALYNEM